ncbi:TerL [Rhodococcus phage ReqiDocB7]|uniref:TerL n=1 Tax=Rhodococcus phage ReqiDocB7 TaxID=691966 RepID=UPI0001CDEA8C|nr:TerL [Rhodococcus phage ReqiDocB7]ADD80789.1 TerL [Rhodococcus phage ReqiDocB7]
MSHPLGPNIDAILAEKKWLDQHPQFEERPATMREFVTAKYLNIEANVRPGVMAALIEIFGDKIDPNWISVKRKAVMTGGIGIGKTTFASIVLPYMVHWVYCLKDPQDFFGLAPGSKIAFMMMSTSEKQATEVLFGDVKARVENSPWFERRCPYDPKFEKQLRFAKKNLWILPGGSEETRFEGYNILGGVIDEGDSHKKTARKDYAEEGYDTIHSRIESRFMDHKAGKFKGILILIGQTKSATGFMRRMYNEFMKEPDAAAIRMSIWESYGWHRYTENPDDEKNYRETAPRKSFVYDVMRKEIIKKEDADAAGIDYQSGNDKFIEVPLAYIAGFIKNPVKALRDLAGIPPEASDPFIAMTHRITECQDRWHERMGAKVPVNDSAHAPKFEPWFKATDRIKRVMHVDIGVSDEGDALGMAMGHVPEIVEIDGEWKPLIVFDFLLRWHAAKGTQIVLGDVRRLIYHLKNDLKFNLTHVTTDSFQSTDFQQQLRKNKFNVQEISVDRKKMPYEDFRDAVYDGRVLFPHYKTHLYKGDTDLVDIAFRELSQLSDTGQKIDHPPKGSKDVADCMAGVVHHLMNDSQFRRGARRDRQDGVNVAPDTFGAVDLSKIVSGHVEDEGSKVMNPVSFDNFDEGMLNQFGPNQPTSLSGSPFGFDPNVPPIW